MMLLLKMNFFQNNSPVKQVGSTTMIIKLPSKYTFCIWYWNRRSSVKSMLGISSWCLHSWTKKNGSIKRLFVWEGWINIEHERGIMMQMQDGVRTNGLTLFIIKDSDASPKRLLLYYFEINNTEFKLNAHLKSAFCFSALPKFIIQPMKWVQPCVVSDLADEPGRISMDTEYWFCHIGGAAFIGGRRGPRQCLRRGCSIFKTINVFLIFACMK